MKQSTKIYLWAWAVVFAAITVWCYWPSHHMIASNPDKLEYIVDLRLPDLTNIEMDDNLARGTSRWDHYEYNAYFVENISEKCIAEMERRCVEDSEHWSKNESKGYYLYIEEGGVDELYCLSCEIYKERVHVECMVSEDEGVLLIAIVWICIQILLLWGLVLLIISLVKRCVAKRTKE